MKNYIYHDTEKAEFILKNGFVDNHIFTDMKILILYYRDILKYKPKKRKEEIYKFCQEHINEFDEILYFRLINKALNNAKKKNKKLIDIDFIPIYKSEIEYINNLPVDYNLRKIIFTILVKIKLTKEVNRILTGDNYTEYFISKNLKDSTIIKLSNINSNKKTIDIFYKLEQMGYIITYYSGATRINILYDMPIDETDIAIEIKDYSNIGYYYDYYNKVNRVKLCVKCGMPFKATGKNSKYCKEHQGYQEKEEIKFKIVTCEDCKKEFKIDARNTTKIRCDNCQKEYVRKKDRIRKANKDSSK